MMALSRKLNKTRADISARINPDILNTMESATERMVREGIDRFSLSNGDTIPSIYLPDVSGFLVDIEVLIKRGPVVIKFYRGHWCPYCNLELSALQEILPKIRRLGGEIVAISPELPDFSINIKHKHDLGFNVLTDAGNVIAEKFGIVYELPPELHVIYDGLGIELDRFNGDSSFRLPIPATFIVDYRGVIRHSFVDPDYTRRQEPEVILSVLREIKAHG